MIGANTHHLAYYFKNTQVFIISMKDIQYQVEKKVKTKTDSKNIIPKKYHT